MNIDKKICTSSATLTAWAILSRIAHAADEETANNIIDTTSKTISAENIEFYGISLDFVICTLIAIGVILIVATIFLWNVFLNIEKSKKQKKPKPIENKNCLNKAQNKKKDQSSYNNRLNNNNFENFNFGNDFLGDRTKKSREEMQKSEIETKIEETKTNNSSYLNEKEQQALWDNFVQDYNNLSLNKTAETGFNKQQAKKKFMQKYQIKKITCSNYEERMRELNGIKKEYSKPIFIDYDINSNMVEQYWATCIQDKIYVIVPKLNISYEQQLHEMAGMKETFESNYKNGSYSKIKVIKPAVFHYENNKWKLILSGKLELIK